MWSVQPVGADLEVSFGVWRDMGYSGQPAAYIFEAESASVATAMDLSVPQSSAGPRRWRDEPRFEEDVETLDVVDTLLHWLRGKHGSAARPPLFASNSYGRVPKAQRTARTWQYVLRLPACLSAAPLFQDAASILWCPGVVGRTFDVPLERMVPGEWQWVFWPAALTVPEYLQRWSLVDELDDVSSPGVACYGALIDATHRAALWPPAHTVISWMDVSAGHLLQLVDTLDRLSADELLVAAEDALLPVHAWALPMDDDSVQADELRFVLLLVTCARVATKTADVLGVDACQIRCTTLLQSMLRAWVSYVEMGRRRRQAVRGSRRSRTTRGDRNRTMQQRDEDEAQRIRRMNVEAVMHMKANHLRRQRVRVVTQRTMFLLRCVWQAFVDTVRLAAVAQQWDEAERHLQQYVSDGQLHVCTSEVCLPGGHLLERNQLVGVPRADAVETDTTITVEYYRPGGENPGDVQSCTTLLVGAVEAGTFHQFQSVPCSTPGFSLCGFQLCWRLWARLPADMDGAVACDAQLAVMGREEGEWKSGSKARGHPFVRKIELHSLVWERCAPSAQQLQAQGLATKFGLAQADAHTDAEGGWDVEGGWDEDDTMSEASWDGEAWNEPGA